VDPRFGTLADLDALVAGAHARGLKLLLDAVPCHTSIEHPWFRDHPERYVWSPVAGPPNNWRATFGGPAWSADPHGRGWYLHSFYPQQPDLDWRHPDVPAALQEVLAFWTARGVDGFRLDAIDRLRKDAQLRDDPPAGGPLALPERPEVAALDPVFSRDRPDVGASVAALRAAIVGAPPRSAWVQSNHDFPRLPDRVGARNARAAALLLLSLPGPAFVYQGDELGLADGPGRTPPHDRAGRDPHRHPMPWVPDAAHAGFTSGDPWLPVIVPDAGTAAEQARAAGSPLALYRDLIALRRQLRGPVEVAASPAPRVRELLLHTHDVQAPPDLLHPGEGLLGRTC
jgi:alpha-glucosidase